MPALVHNKLSKFEISLWSALKELKILSVSFLKGNVLDTKFYENPNAFQSWTHLLSLCPTCARDQRALCSQNIIRRNMPPWYISILTPATFDVNAIYLKSSAQGTQRSSKCQCWTTPQREVLTLLATHVPRWGCYSTFAAQKYITDYSSSIFLSWSFLN